MNKIRIFFYLSLLVLLSLTSCEVLNQISQMGNLAKCDFRLQSVQNLTLAGVNVQQVTRVSDLNLLETGRLAAALAANKFPLDFTLNLEAKNPNTNPAGMTQIEWILLIDEIEMTRGTLDQQVSIPANNGIATIPIKMQFDLKQALAGKSADAILNFGLNLAGAGNAPTRFTLQMKPTITVNGWPITYPGYLNVKTEYGGK